MRVLPILQAAAPAVESPYGIMICPPPTSAGEFLGLLALGGLTTGLPFLIGRFWGRRWRDRGLPHIPWPAALGLGAVVAWYFILFRADSWFGYWSYIGPFAASLLSALTTSATLCAVAGARAGFAEEGRFVATAGFAWALLSLLLLPASTGWMFTALAAGLLLSSLCDIGAVARGQVPRGWNALQAIWSVALLPPALFAALFAFA